MAFRLTKRPGAAAVAAVAIAAAGCSNSAPESQAPTVERLKVARVLGVAPTSCPPPNPRRERVSAGLAPLAGRKPVWAGFYARLDVATGALHLPRDAPRTPNGWRIKTLWAVASGHTGVVQVRGHEVKTRARLRFDVGEAAVSTMAVLDPATPGTVTSGGEPKEFPSYLYFPAAGCYELEATWPGGKWKMVLGVGR